MSFLPRIRALAVLLLAIGAAPLQASNFTWTGLVSSDWLNATNWSPNGVPGQSDTATITNGSPTITNALSVATVDLGGGTLTVTTNGALSVGTAFNWTNGIYRGALAIASTATMTLSNANGTLDLPGAQIVNNGTVIWAAGTLRGNSSTAVTNNAIWLTETDNQFNNNYGGAPNFYNNGSFTKLLTTNATQFSSVAFNNAGSVLVQSGTILFSGGGTFAGTLLATNKTQINFANGGYLDGTFTGLAGSLVSLSGGTFTYGPNLVFNGPGAYALTQNASLTLTNDVIPNLTLLGGTVYLGAAFQNAGAVTNLTLTGSTLAGTNTLTGTMNWIAGQINGIFTIASGGALNLSGSANVIQAAALTNSGHITWNGAGNWGVYSNPNGGIIANLPGGVIDIQCNCAMGTSGNAAFINAGLLRKSLSSGITTIIPNFTNTATVELESGVMAFNSAGSFGGTFTAANGTALNFYGGGLLSGSFTAGYGGQINFISGSFAPTPTVSFNGPGTSQLSGGSLTLLNSMPNLQLSQGTVTLASNFENGTIANLTLSQSNSTVSLTGSNTVTGTFNLDGNVSGPLNIAPGAVFNWSGGTLSGPLTIASNATLNITGSQVNLNGTLTNFGTINWNSGTFSADYSGVICNQAGATFNINCDGTFDTYDVESFNNAGLLQKTAATGTTFFYTTLTNTGTVYAQSGTLSFTGASDSYLGGFFLAQSGAELEFGSDGYLDGTLTAASGATINLVGGNYTYSPTATLFNGPGSNLLTVSATITLLSNTIPNFQLIGGTVIPGPSFQGGAITNLILNGASLGGTNIVTGTLTLGGTENAYSSISGPLTIASNATLNVVDYLEVSAGLTNAGVVNWSGGEIYVNYNGAVYNEPGGVFNVQCDQSLSVYSYNYGDSFYNAGLFRKSGTVGDTYVYGYFTNTSVVEVASGTLYFSTPVVNLGGTFQADAGGVLNFADGGSLTGNYYAAQGGTITLSGGTFTNTTTTAFNGPGNYIMTGGTDALLFGFPTNLTLQGGSIIPGPFFQGGMITNVSLPNGVGLAGTNVLNGALTLSGNLTGPLTVSPGSTLNLSGDVYAPLILEANSSASITGYINSPITVASNASLTIYGEIYASLGLSPGATFNWIGGYLEYGLLVPANANFNLLGPSEMDIEEVSVTNNGTITWSGGDIYMDYDSAFYNESGATFNIQSNGALLAEATTGSSAPFFNNAGVLRKSLAGGTNQMGSLFTNSSLIDVEAGTLQFGAVFTQTSGASWDLGIDGPGSNGQLGFAGLAPLAGTLGVHLNNNYVLGLSNSFTLLTYTSTNGSFSQVSLPTNGASWQLNYGGAALTMTDTNLLAPKITLTSPANNAAFVTPASVPIRASVVGAGAAITAVDFYQGTNLLGQGVPGGGGAYSFTWTLAPPGLYALSARAIDANGAAGTSAPVNIVIYSNHNPSTNFTWIGSASSDWFNPTNWSPAGVPGKLDDVNINNGATVNISQNTSVNNLDFSAGALQGPGVLTVTNVFNWAGGTLSNIITIASNGTFNISGSSNLNWGGATVTNNGATVWTGASLGSVSATTSNATVVNNGLWLIETDSTIVSGTFINNGILRKAITTNTTTTEYGTFNNNGTVDVQAGKISMLSGGMLSGVYNTAQGTLLTFGGGNFAISNVPSFTGAGSNEFTGRALNLALDAPAALQLIGGTVTLGPAFQNNGAITNLTIAGATLSGTNTVAGTLNFKWGTLAGALTISSNAVLNLGSTNAYNSVYMSGVAMANFGQVNWLGSYLSCSSATITNNGLWLAEPGQTSYNQLESGTFMNNGVFRCAGTYAVEFYPDSFVNNGLVDVESSMCYLGGGGSFSGGYNAAAGSAIYFNEGAFTLGSIPNFSGPGLFELSSGATVTLENDVPPNLQLSGGIIKLGPKFQNAGAINSLTLSGATLSGNYVVTGSMTIGGGALSGSLTVQSNATLNIVSNTLTLASASLTNFGTVLWTGGDIDTETNAVVNDGLWLAQSTEELSLSEDYDGQLGTFLNNGIFRIQAPYVYVEGNLIFDNAGLVDAESGYIYFESGGSIGGTYNTTSQGYVYFYGGSFSNSSPANFTGNGTNVFEYGNLLLASDQLPNLSLLGGTVTVGPQFQNKGAITNLTINGAMLNGTNVVSGTLNWLNGQVQGNLTILTNALLNIAGASVKTLFDANVANFGAVLWTGGQIQGNSNSVITNNGLWLVQTDQQITSDYYPYTNFTFVNNGTFSKSATSGTTSIYYLSFLNSGVLDIESGAVQFFAPSVYRQAGAGLTFGVSAPNLAGQLILYTNVALDGTLTVNALNGYVPAVGDVITPITYAYESGTFANVNLPSQPMGQTWNVDYGPGALHLNVVSTNLAPQIATPLQVTGTVIDTSDHAVAGVTVYATASVVTNLIQNGSFETPLVNSVFYYTPGSANINGWAVVGPTNDNVALQSLFGPAEDGNQYLNIGGSTGGAGVTQTFPTSLGVSYQLTFYHGAYSHLGYYPVLGVTVASTSNTFGETSGTGGNLDWREVEIPFTATSNSTTVGFFELTGTGNNDSFVDNVQVVPAGNGTVFQATTDSTGSYQLTLPAGGFLVGLNDLSAAGYNSVAAQPVTLTTGNQTLNFAPSPRGGSQDFAIDTAVSPAGAGTVTPSQNVPAGTLVTLTAAANTNVLPYLFSSWTENGVVESSNSTYSFTAVRNRSLVANFILPGFLVAVSNNPPSAGVINGTGGYAYGATAVLTAFPFYGYTFASWSEGGAVVSTNNPFTTKVYTNLSLVANYNPANLVHLVTTATSPNDVAAVTGAGTYTNGQAGVFFAPPLTTNSGNVYYFQNFTEGTNVVSTLPVFTKIFSTVDPPDLQFVAIYVPLPLNPELVRVTQNYADPVPATTNFVLTLQFDRSMKSSPTPTILMTNPAPGAIQPVVRANGKWFTTAISNDTYQTPPVTFSSGMDGAVQVFVSGAQDLLDHVLPSTLATTLTVATKPQLAPAVSVTSPGNGASFAASASFTISATASSGNGVKEVDFFANGVLLGKAAQTGSPYSFVVSGLSAGSYALTVVAIDNLNLTGTSAPVHVTLNAPGQTLIDFEALNASPGPVTGATLSNYLAGYGVLLSNVTASTSVAVEDDQVFGNGQVTVASSGDNFLTQIGASGAVSYTLVFSQPYASVSWVRTLLLAGATGVSAPTWRAHAFDASGNELGAVGESQLLSYTNIPAAPFTLFGPNIASIRFDANNNGVSQLSSLALDDLSLSTVATNTSLTVSLTSGAGSSLTAPGLVNLVAQVGDNLATPTEIEFYEGQNLLGSITPGGAGSFTFPVQNLAAASYTFTAVAMDSVGTARTSIPLTVTVQSASGITVINFDAPEATVNLSNYLAGFGVAASNVTVGSHLEAVSGTDLSISATALPSSPPNLLTQVGANQPVSFTLNFAAPLQSLSFTRVALLAGVNGISHPQWTATIFDASGTTLGLISESQIISSTNVPARTFQLFGSGIASVRFDSVSGGVTAFVAVLLDDLVLNTNPISSPPLRVSLTSPVSGNTFTAPATVNLAATANDTLGAIAAVSFYSGSALIGSAATSPYTYSWTNVPAGIYSIRAEAVDSSGLAVFSAPVSITVSPGGNSAIVSFDSLNASTGPVTGAPLSNYLAAVGISVGNASPGTQLAIENQALISGGTSVIGSSVPNLLTQIGSNGPVSFTLQFVNPLSQFSFTRPELLANPFVSHPAWTATAYDGSGAVLSSTGAPLISSYSNVPAQIFTLTGPGISSIQFDSLGSGLTTFNSLLLDDLLLTTNAATPPNVAITNPISSQFFVAPATIEIDATATGSSAGIGQVAFYANNNLVGVVSSPSAGSEFSILWTNDSIGAYSLTAVAKDNNGLIRTSAPVNISFIPSPFAFGISQQPQSQTVGAGTVAFFNVVTTGGSASGIAYQWFLNGAALNGQTNSMLTVFPVQNVSAGTYTVQVSSGGQTIPSSGAVLTVAQPPVFTVLPQPQVVNVGGTINLTGAASGTGPFSYQWLLNGTPIGGATNNAYVVIGAQTRNSGNYQLVIQNPLAFAKSPLVSVSVQVNNGVFESADYFSNRISINPLLGPVMGSNTNATGEPGDPMVDGKPGGKPIWYTWTSSFTGVITLTTQGSDFDTLLGIYTGTVVSNLTPIADDDDSGGFFTSLVTFNVAQGVAYQIAVDGFQGASGTVILGMPSPASYQVTTNTVPAIQQGPTNQLVQPGATVTLSVISTGGTTCQWSFNSAPILDATNDDLVIADFEASAVGVYSVLVANPYGSAQSEPASVQIAVQNNGTPSSSEDKLGDAVDLSKSQTNPAPAITLSDGGGDTRGYSISQSFSTVQSTKEPGEPDHCGQAGGASEWYVYTTPAAGTFHCTTAGSTFNTILAVYTGPGTNYDSLVEQGCGYTTNYQTQGQPDVTLPNIAAGTKFYIAVDGYLGAVGTAKLSIGVGQEPALVSPPQDEIAGLGGPATFNVVANGSTNFSYQWQLNGVNLARATNSSFTIQNVQSNSLGSYSVVVSNIIAAVTSSPPSLLALQFTPAITAEPASETAVVGSSATLSFGVAGMFPLQYQWLFDGKPIKQATNSTLTLTPVTTANVGSYSVVVSNSLGTVTSSNAILTVRTSATPPPTIVIASPVNNLTTTNPVLKVTGTASSKVGISNVMIEVGSAGFQPANGTASWSATNVDLLPGTNVITVMCSDKTGLSATATRNVIYTPTAQLTVLVSPNTKVGATSSTTAINGKWLVIGKTYSISAIPVPRANWLFADWTSGTVPANLSLLTTNSKLSFVMATNLVLQANFVTNLFTARAGSYNGLFSPNTGIAEQSSGLLTATIPATSTGTYSARLSLDGGSYPFTGAFDLAGESQVIVKRAGKTSVTVFLNLNVGAVDNLMTGAISNNAAGSWLSGLTADRAVFTATGNPATNYRGKFTAILPPAPTAPVASPGGYGYATFTNNAAGTVVLAGYLADGTSIGQSVPISQNGEVPVYVSLYAGGGSLQGWLAFTNVPPQTLFGNLTWTKPPTAAKTLYLAGFATSAEVLGSPYLPPAKNQPTLELTNGILTIAEGNLAEPLVFNVALSNNTLVKVAGAGAPAPTNNLSIAFTPATGVMTVTFRPTGARVNATAQGVVLQNQTTQPNSTNAAGWFKGTNQTGSFLLQ